MKPEKLIVKGVQGTGEQAGKPIIIKGSVIEWNLSGHIVAMSFNTTSANTGLKNGSAET